MYDVVYHINRAMYILQRTNRASYIYRNTIVYDTIYVVERMRKRIVIRHALDAIFIIVLYSVKYIVSL